MNILITGAGLIGSHCARQAVDAGNKVVLFDLSPNRDYLQKVVGKDRADVVAADMRDLPALISAMERHNVDTVVHTAGLIGSRVAENSYTEQYKLDCIIIRPSGVFGRGHYVGGSTVGKVMRDLALNTIKGQPFTIDAKTYGPNEYVYGKDVGLALFLACQAQNPKQRVYNAGSGVVTGPEALAQTVRELAPQTDIKVIGSSGTASEKSVPLDLSTSKAELGYTPKFPLKEALRNYMEELWEEQRS